MTSSTFSFLFSLSPFLFSFPIFFSHLFLSSRSLLYSSIPSFLFFPSIPFLLLLFPSVFFLEGFSSLSLKMGVLHEPCCSEISEVLCFLSYYFCMSNPVKNYYSYCMEKTKMFRKFTKKIFFTPEFAVDFEISRKLSHNHHESFINFPTNNFSSFYGSLHCSKNF